MPKTKLDKHRISKAEAEKSIIYQAMARNHIYSHKELSKCIGISECYLSRCFKNGFSANAKIRIAGALNLTEDECRTLLGVLL